MQTSRLEEWSRPELERELGRLRAKLAARERTSVAPAETAPEDVSFRATHALLEVLDRQVGSERVDRLLAEAGLCPGAVRGRRGWMPWSDYEAVLDAIEPLVSSGDLRAAGRLVLDSPIVRFLGMGIRTLPSLELAMAWLARIAVGPGGLLFRNGRPLVRRRSPSEVELTFLGAPGTRYPEAFLEIARGTLGTIPALAGSSRATVRAERGQSSITWVVEHDPPSRFRRLRAVASSLASPGLDRALEEGRAELALRNDELRQRIVELEASKRARGALQAATEEQERMETLGRFVGGVAHDLNNLLTVVLTQTGALRRALRPEAMNDLLLIEEACDRAAALCRQLLAVGRREPMELEIFDLRWLVYQRQALLAAAAGEPIRIRWSLDEAAKVLADPSSLERVLLDLVTNAREAMPSGGELTVEVSRVTLDEVAAEARPGLAPGAYARMSVEDDGSGMSPEVREHALEPFYTTRDHRRALGLGLSTAFGIARQLGGTLTIRSEPGQGTEVSVYVPLAEGP